MASPHRRQVIQASAAAAAGAALIASQRSASAAAARQVQVALIGCGGRGSGVIGEFAKLPDVKVAAVCDPDAARLAAVAKKQGPGVSAHSDFRRILDDKSIDAVVVATPDHWHAPAAILAAEAGKHVYVEKPCSHNFREGSLLVQAARRHKRVVQHGTQSRSSDLIAGAIQALRDGLIGEVKVAKAWNVQRRGEIGRAKPGSPPSGFDYDMWVGPAPMVPFQSNRHHYSWHWWYDFGTGDTGNDGVHELDIARWGLGVEQHPQRIGALGGKLAFDDDQQFPDTQYASFDYPASGSVPHRQLIFEMRLWSRYGLEGVDNGNAFYGDSGWMLLSKRGICKVFDERNRPRQFKLPELRLSNHFQNFVDAVRGDAKPRAEIAIGHASAALCHFANISTRIGRSFEFDPKAEITSDPRAAELLKRTYREGHWAVPQV